MQLTGDVAEVALQTSVLGTLRELGRGGLNLKRMRPLHLFLRADRELVDPRAEDGDARRLWRWVVRPHAPKSRWDHSASGLELHQSLVAAREDRADLEQVGLLGSRQNLMGRTQSIDATLSCDSVCQDISR